MNEKIEAIRQEVIKANPTDPRWNVILAGDEKVRLADVLLAIKESESYGYYVPSVDCEGFFRAETGIVIGDEENDLRWNLRADDLTQQSPETIDFLYSLLVAPINESK